MSAQKKRSRQGALSCESGDEQEAARVITDRGRKTSLLALCTKEVESLSMLKEEKRELRHKGHLSHICKR